MTRIAFTVLGLPIAQGSKRHVGGGRMVESSNRLRPWRALVSSAAHDARGDMRPFAGPVNVVATFVFPRPKKHYRTGRHAAELRADAPVFHTSRGDVDKLSRALLDALVDGGVLLDDGQVSILNARKVYAAEWQSPHVSVAVEMLDAYDRLEPQERAA